MSHFLFAFKLVIIFQTPRAALPDGFVPGFTAHRMMLSVSRVAPTQNAPTLLQIHPTRPGGKAGERENGSRRNANTLSSV